MAVDQVEKTIRLDLFIFNPALTEKNTRARGAYADPSRVAQFTPDDMVQLEGATCDIYFHRKGKQFRGEMKRGACAFAVDDAPADGSIPGPRPCSVPICSGTATPGFFQTTDPIGLSTSDGLWSWTKSSRSELSRALDWRFGTSGSRARYGRLTPESGLVGGQ